MNLQEILEENLSTDLGYRNKDNAIIIREFEGLDEKTQDIVNTFLIRLTGFGLDTMIENYRELNND